MRITLLSFNFTDYTMQLATALSQNAVTIQLIITDFPRNLEQEEKRFREYLNTNGKTLNYSIYSQPRLYNIKYFLLNYRIFKQIISFDPDVVHIIGGCMWFSFLLPLLRIKKYQLITTFHDPKPHLGEKDLSTRIIFYFETRYSDKIIVHGKKLKEIMMKEYGIANEKIYSITIGEHMVAPFKKYENKDLKEDGNLILFFGRIQKYKGLEYLIKAEPLIKNHLPDAKIIIAGGGKRFKEYEKMIVNKESFIIHNHYISFQEGAELFQRASIVVLPYIEASQSGVVVTAYGFKKPVIVTNTGSIPEIVDDNITGLIVPPKNSIALAEAVIKLMKDENLRIRMGENAYKKLKKD
ncbi:partial Alpha-D-kanosaminyltransferase, partial [Patescibacteria group bacterium]